MAEVRWVRHQRCIILSSIVATIYSRLSQFYKTPENVVYFARNSKVMKIKKKNNETKLVELHVIL